jgi:hypothetical protein
MVMENAEHKKMNFIFLKDFMNKIGHISPATDFYETYSFFSDIFRVKFSICIKRLA